VPFTVVWKVGHTVLTSTPFHDLNTAKAHATDLFPTQQQQLGVTAVEIVDDAGLRHFIFGAEDA